MTQSAHPAPTSLRSALEDLAYNLRWSWDPQTADVFRSLAPDVWEATRNPVAVVRAVDGDSNLLAGQAWGITAARQALEAYLTAPPHLPGAPRVAYCCAEFAVAECLPIYAGGLGVLAGDHLKAASDLGLPLVGVGLFYRFGYFRQALDETGWQRERYDRLEPADLPLRPVQAAAGTPLKVEIPFSGRTVAAQVWRAQVGRVPLYLLDTDLAENREDDRWITGHLYGGDADTRIRQEMVLGLGGARLLRALAEQPEVYHLNEGHSSFIVLELARQRVADGLAASFAEGLAQVAARVAFTTHTPVAAGHDTFGPELVEANLGEYRSALGLTLDELIALGQRERGHAPGNGLAADVPAEGFSMTLLALHGAARRNGVSQLHGVVSREMWGGVGVGVGVHGTPPAAEMGAVTNGIHTATWVGPEMSALFDRAIGQSWRQRPDASAAWEGLRQVDRACLWAARTSQRARLLERAEVVARAAREAGITPAVDAQQALVIGFARRFATYKRAALLLAEPDRLARLLHHPGQPVVLIFAGKAHPRDEPGKALMQRIVHTARDERFRGRLLFLEGYDLQLARYLVQGCDVWLNTPRRPLEASGTSGMKAALNGAQHLSELDGWWDEAYRPDLGWALGEGIPQDLEGDAREAAEARQLMDLLEQVVVPLYFERTPDGTPHGWLERVVASIRTLGPAFSAQRMVCDYAQQVYTPAAAASTPVLDAPLAAPR